MIKWKVWYTNGITYTSKEIQWRDLPESGVLAVCLFGEPPYKTVRDGGDWYWLEDGMIYKVSSTGWDSWEPKPEGVDPSLVKQGVAVSDEEFQRITEEVRRAKWQ